MNQSDLLPTLLPRAMPAMQIAHSGLGQGIGANAVISVDLPDKPRVKYR